MTVPRYPPWWQGTPGLSTGESGDESDPSATPSFIERTLTVAAENSVVPVVYGQVDIGGMVFAAGLDGSNLVVAYAVCLGPATLDKLCIDGQEYLPGQNINGIQVGTWHDGTWGQSADPWLTAIGCGDDLNGNYDGELFAVAYIVLKVDVSVAIPTPKFTISANSSNPAEALKYFIESKITGYGKTVDADAAIAYCNETINSKPRRTINGAIASAASVESRIDLIRAYAGCDVNMSGDTVVLIPRRATGGVTSRTVTAADIVEESFSITQPATSDIPNHIAVAWSFRDTDPDEDCDTLRDVTQEAEWDDGSGERRTQALAFPFCTDASMAHREAFGRLNYYRYNTLTAQADTFDESLSTLVGDVVSLDHPLLGGARDMRIVAADVVSPGRWQLQFETHNDLMYPDSTAPNPTFPSYDFPSAGGPPTPSPTATNVTIAERLEEIAPCIYDIYLDISWDAVSHTGPVDYLVWLTEYAAAPDVFTGTVEIRNQNEVHAIGAFASAAAGNLLQIENMPSAENNLTWRIDSVVNDDQVLLVDGVRANETVTASSYNGAVNITATNRIVASGAFVAASVGQKVALSGFTDPANAGDFTIDAVISADVIDVLPATLVIESAPTATVDLIGATLTRLATGDALFQETTSNTSLSFGPVNPLVTYVANVVVQADGLRDSSVAIDEITTSSDSLVVPDVQNFSGSVVCDAIASLSWQAVVVCALGYEIRWGASGVDWASANFLARVDALAYTHAPAPGDYDYLIRAFTATYERNRIEYSLNDAKQSLTISACCCEEEPTAACLPLDPDFETPALDVWYGDFALANSPVRSGINSLGTSGAVNFYVRQDFYGKHFTVATALNLKFFAQETGGTAQNMSIEVTYWDRSGNSDINFEDPTVVDAATPGSWNENDVSLNAPIGTEHITIYFGASSLTTFLEDIEFTPCIELVTSQGNFPLDGDPDTFMAAYGTELNAVTAWIQTVDGISNAQAHSGTYSYSDQFGSPAYLEQYRHIEIVGSDTPTDFILWALNTDLVTPWGMNVRAECYDIDGNTIASFDEYPNVPAGSTWTQFTYPLTVPTGTAALYFFIEAYDSQIYIDDISVSQPFVEIGPGPRRRPT